MLEQVLDTVTQGCGRAGTAGARAAHVQINNAIAEPGEGNVAAILSNRRAHARFQQFLDGFYRLLILRCIVAAGTVIGAIRFQDRSPRHVVFHDGAEDHGLQMLPLGHILGHRYEIGAQEHAFDTINVKQACSKRRCIRFRTRTKISRTRVKHGLARNELQRCRIGCRFGLDEHSSSPSLPV